MFSRQKKSITLIKDQNTHTMATFMGTTQQLNGNLDPGVRAG